MGKRQYSVSVQCPSPVCMHFDGHFFFRNVKNHTQRVETWSIEFFKNGRSNFKMIVLPR